MPTPAIRNNNPGNLKAPSTGQFQQFQKPEDGFTALLNDLEGKKRGTTTTGLGPDSTLFEFSSTYAPASDNNNPAQYTVNLANKLGVSPHTKLKELDTLKWAYAVAEAEDRNSPYGSGQMGGSYPTPAPPKTESLLMAPKTEEPVEKKGLGRKALEFAFPILEDKPRTGLQTAGDVALSALTLVPGAGLLGVGAKGFKAASTAGKTMEGLQGLARGPLSTRNIGIGAGTGYGFDVSGSLSEGETAPSEVLTPGVGTAIGAAGGGLVRRTAGEEIKRIVSDVTPELSRNKGIASLAQTGAQKTGIRGLITPNETPKSRVVADTVSKYVPGYGGLKTYTEKLNATKQAISSLADNLKREVVESGGDIIYPFRELNSRLSSIAKPIEIEADTVQARKFDLARQAAIRIAKEEGGKISNLFDARKKFDDLVEREFPTLYDRANAPMRSAITAIRREMNEFIEEQLASKGVRFTESLRNQSRLFDAVDSLAPKAYGEIGTTGVGRFLNKHPLAKNLGVGALGGLVPAGIASYVTSKLTD